MSACVGHAYRDSKVCADCRRCFQRCVNAMPSEHGSSPLETTKLHFRLGDFLAVLCWCLASVKMRGRHIATLNFYGLKLAAQ